MLDIRASGGTSRARCALAAVAVALFGLLSMHGWGSHSGAHLMGATTSPSANLVIVAGDPGDHGHSGPGASQPNASAQEAAGHPAGMASDEPAESGTGLLGLCLAVLAGLVLTIALLLARRRVRIPRTLLPAWQPPVSIRRDHDPPSLHMLRVIRC
jgi:hypothetical protein